MADKPNKTKELFIKTADKLFFQHGYENVSVDEICKQAGKAKGLFFYYFDKKENIVKLLFEMQVKRMGKVLKRRLADDEDSIARMNTLMQALFDERSGGPRAIYYFKARPMPGWADSFVHKLKDLYIFPLIRDTVAEGAELGIFRESDEKQTEIIYLGISQFMHRHYDKMSDPEYAKEALHAVTYVLEKSLGVEHGKIKLIKDSED